MKTYLHTFSQTALILAATSALAFEGRIQVVATRGGETNALLYTVGTNCLRIEVINSNASPTGWPNPVDLVDPNSGTLTLLFPHNRSFVRLKPASEAGSAAMPGMALPLGSLPPGLPHQFHPTGMGPGPQGMPAMPKVPMMPPMPAEQADLLATGDETNMFGLACQRYELKQRGETMEIWATEALLPFRPYAQSQPHRFGPRRLEEQFPDLLATRKLFPLLVTRRYHDSTARVCFEVASITPAKIRDPDGHLFAPPPNYREIEPLPF